MAPVQEEIPQLQSNNNVSGPAGTFGPGSHRGARRPSDQRGSGAGGGGGGGSFPSSSRRGRRSSGAGHSGSGDVRVLDQVGAPPMESGSRSELAETSAQVNAVEQSRGEPSTNFNRGFDNRRGSRRGDPAGRGRDGPRRRNDVSSDRHGTEDFRQGQRERDSVEDVEGELRELSIQGGVSRNNSQSRRNHSYGRQTSGSGDVRLEAVGEDGNPPANHSDRRDDGRRGGDSCGGRFRGGHETMNWRHNKDTSSRPQANNHKGRVTQKVPDSGHNGPGSANQERDTGQHLGFPKIPGEKMNVPQLVQELEVKLSKGKVECMICYDSVNRTAPVWSCTQCYNIFHLPCIRKWARAPISNDLAVSSSGTGEANWRCPGCQTVQMISANELRYYCFCGQVEEPQVDYYITPHSCGGPCKKTLDKSRNGQCQHHCTMQCHPGPCPPCTALAPPQPCPCGKTTNTRRCSEQAKGAGTCGQHCGRPLLCGRHNCVQACHEGACQSCDVLFEARCFCGALEEGMLCGHVEPPGQINADGAVFSCQTQCPKTLPCGNHRCKNFCHPGSCGECELSPSVVHTCPCGKKDLTELLDSSRQRQSCTDPIPTCQQSCEKRLPCDKHFCRDLCHLGPCPPCEVSVEQKCQCEASSRTVPCRMTVKPEVMNIQQKGKEKDEDVDMDVGYLFLCDRKCGQKKSCGRHRCNDRCCPLASENGASQLQGRDPHICMLPCGKKLRCKQHSCEELCHSGHCPPCMETTFTELSCSCGRTSIPPPVPCGTPLPSCQFPCSIPQACGHEATHLCHFGDCPPCTVPVAKECVGNHVVLRGPPCGSRDIKCNKLCGKTRQCGLHACARTCHLPPCDSADGGSSGHSCGQPCGAPRRHCSHTCASPCHPTTQCPEISCKEMVTILCVCGRLKADVPCGAGGSTMRGATDVATMALARLPGPLQPVEGKDKERVPLGQRKLACDDECAILEKKRLLADAFGATAPGEGVPGLDGGVVGSEILAEFVRRDPQWVAAIEDRFKYLVQGPKGGTGPVGSLRLHVFCVMVKERREVIYQMAERWGLSVNGVGREPRRFVIVHITQKSKVPARTLLPKSTNSAVGVAGPIRAPPFNSQVDMEPGLVVALFDLPRDVSTNVSTLVLRFGGECELVWVNDKNALAVFADGARAATALRRVDHASAYKGAAGMPPIAGPSSGRGGAWGTQGVLPSGIKSNPVRKGVQDSTWVEDAWGDEQRGGKQEVGAWQSKIQPVSTSKNPWGALAQTGSAASSSGPAEGILSQRRPSSVSNSNNSSRSVTAGAVVSTLSRVAVPNEPGHESSISGAPLLPPPLPDGEDDDWEKALE